MSPSLAATEARQPASEVKFLLTEPEAADILCWAREMLRPDPFGAGPHGDQYHVTSLYLDTSKRDVFHRRGSYGRSKYRVRRYGESQAVFLERKTKKNERVTKRRSIVSAEEILRLETGYPVQKGWAGYWFHRRLQARSLHAVCQIGYERIARFGLAPAGPVRLTMDRALCLRPARGFQFLPEQEEARLLDTQMILELKYPAKMPELFINLVREFSLTPQPVSKYRLAACRLGLAGDTAFLPPARCA